MRIVVPDDVVDMAEKPDGAHVAVHGGRHGKSRHDLGTLLADRSVRNADVGLHLEIEPVFAALDLVALQPVGNHEVALFEIDVVFGREHQVVAVFAADLEDHLLAVGILKSQFLVHDLGAVDVLLDQRSGLAVTHFAVNLGVRPVVVVQFARHERSGQDHRCCGVFKHVFHNRIDR